MSPAGTIVVDVFAQDSREVSLKNGENVTLRDTIVVSAEIYEVCDTIVLGPNLHVSGRRFPIGH